MTSADSIIGDKRKRSEKEDVDCKGEEEDDDLLYRTPLMTRDDLNAVLAQRAMYFSTCKKARVDKERVQELHSKKLHEKTADIRKERMEENKKHEEAVEAEKKRHKEIVAYLRERKEKIEDDGKAELDREIKATRAEVTTLKTTLPKTATKPKFKTALQIMKALHDAPPNKYVAVYLPEDGTSESETVWRPPKDENIEYFIGDLYVPVHSDPIKLENVISANVSHLSLKSDADVKRMYDMNLIECDDIQWYRMRLVLNRGRASTVVEKVLPMYHRAVTDSVDYSLVSKKDMDHLCNRIEDAHTEAEDDGRVPFRSVQRVDGQDDKVYVVGELCLPAFMLYRKKESFTKSSPTTAITTSSS